MARSTSSQSKNSINFSISNLLAKSSSAQPPPPPVILRPTVIGGFQQIQRLQHLQRYYHRMIIPPAAAHSSLIYPFASLSLIHLTKRSDSWSADNGNQPHHHRQPASSSPPPYVNGNPILLFSHILCFYSASKRGNVLQVFYFL